LTTSVANSLDIVAGDAASYSKQSPSAIFPSGGLTVARLFVQSGLA
jgi:hypothetical protein